MALCTTGWEGSVGKVQGTCDVTALIPARGPAGGPRGLVRMAAGRPCRAGTSVFAPRAQGTPAHPAATGPPPRVTLPVSSGTGDNQLYK